MIPKLYRGADIDPNSVLSLATLITVSTTQIYLDDNLLHFHSKGFENAQSGICRWWDAFREMYVYDSHAYTLLISIAIAYVVAVLTVYVLQPTTLPDRYSRLITLLNSVNSRNSLTDQTGDSGDQLDLGSFGLSAPLQRSVCSPAHSYRTHTSGLEEDVIEISEWRRQQMEA